MITEQNYFDMEFDVSIDTLDIMPIAIEAGKVFTIALINSAGAKELELKDNADVLDNMPSLYASLDGGDTYEMLTAKFMRKLAASTSDMLLRIDCTQLRKGAVYKITDIQTDTGISQATSTEEDVHFHYDSPVRTINEDMLKQAVTANIHELNNLAQDSNGWPVTYYRAELLKNIDVLNAESLKAIRTCKQVTAFFPHRKMIGQLDFDSFGLAYEELTTLHILPDEFARVYENKFARPNRSDIVYIAVLDQFFEVTDVTDQKTPLNTIAYYELTLRFVSDRQAVAKDDDILDITDMVDSTKEFDIADIKANKSETIDCIDRTWSHQKFVKAQLKTILPTTIAYGIAYNGSWLKVKISNGKLRTTSLDNKNEQVQDITEPMDMYFAKYAEFSKELSVFDETMYYSTPTISRTLQPLDLLELQIQV